MSLIDSLINTGASVALAAPVNSFNSLMGRINQAVQNPLQRANKYLLSATNPYARENVLSKMAARNDPVLSCDWIAAVIDPTPQIGWEYIDAITTPSLEMGQHEWFFNGINKKFASSHTCGTMTLKFYTDINGVSVNYAYAWFRSTFRTDGFFTLAGKHKRDVVLFLLDAKRQTVVDFRYTGCFPISYESMSLGADSSIVETTLTLSVDQVKMSADNDLSAAMNSIAGMFPQIPNLTGIAGL